MKSINEAGLKILKEFEAGPQGNSQPALTPYHCPAGVLTIGWGHTHGVTPGMMIGVGDAELFLAQDLADSCETVERAVEGAVNGTTNNEFAALVLLCFNIGAGNFLGSTPLRLHKAGKKTDAANSFSLWRKCANPLTGKLEDSPGLIRRRNAEANLYLQPPFQERATPQEVAPEKPAAASKTVIVGSLGALSGAGALVDQASSVRDIVDNVTAATTSVGALKVAVASLTSGKGVAVALTAIAVLCVAAVVVRYVLKARKGDVTVR